MSKKNNETVAVLKKQAIYKNKKGKSGRPYAFGGKRVAVAHENNKGWRIDFVDGRESVLPETLEACDKHMDSLYPAPAKKPVKKSKKKAAPKSDAQVAKEAKALGDIRGAELNSLPTLEHVEAVAKAADLAELTDLVARARELRDQADELIRLAMAIDLRVSAYVEEHRLA